MENKVENTDANKINVNKIIKLNIIIFLVYMFLIDFMNIFIHKISELKFSFLSTSIPLHAFILAILAVVNLGKKDKTIAQTYMILSLIVLLIGFPACIASLFYMNKFNLKP